METEKPLDTAPADGASNGEPAFPDCPVSSANANESKPKEEVRTVVEGESSSVVAGPAEEASDVSLPPQDGNKSSDETSHVKANQTPSSGVNNQEVASSKPPPVTVFEEETRSSFPGDGGGTKVAFKESAVDEDSQNSFSSHKSSAQKRRHSDDEAGSSLSFPPENVFEYMWPPESGDFFFLQEQISDYLNVKSFKRKYPDLPRRAADKAEKQFLRERGVVSETQCELGLTALRSEDVMELMCKDYPDKYRDYIRVLREKEKQTITEKHKQYTSSVDRNRMGDVARKAAKSAAEYNAQLNQERKEERRCCFDLQTFTIHYPKGRNKKVESVKMGKYPIALLPGQFQDGYREYTAEELKYLPLDTVLYGPLQEVRNISQPMSDSSRSDSEESTGSDASCSSSQGTHDDGSGESSSSSEKNEKSHGMNSAAGSTLPADKSTRSGATYKPKDKPNAVCKVCKLRSGTARDEKNEPMVHCSACDKSGHFSCLQLPLDMVEVLRTYPWQCMDCKTCVHCNDPYNEDKMLFCDACDRGYHTFCVGLKSLPQGKWICKLCGRCSVCGSTQPGPEGSKAQWQYDSTVACTSSEPVNSIKQRQVVCQACSKRKR